MKPYYSHNETTIYHGHTLSVLKELPNKSVQMCVTSPPYWGLRDYNVEGQVGLEQTPKEYVDRIVQIFREVKRVIKDDGVLFLNLGDSYAGSTGQTGGQGLNTYQKEAGATDKNMRQSKIAGLKPKDLIGIPWRCAFALQADGWTLRSDIIWQKPSCMPESVKDRPTKSHEYIFLLTKSTKYYYNHKAIMEDSVDPESYKGRRYRGPKAIVGANARPFSKPNTLDKGNKADGRIYPKRNKRSVWTITPKPFTGWTQTSKSSHFATFPPEIPRTCILAGSKKGDTILDPFAGAMTSLLVAQQLHRKSIGIELNEDYIKNIGIPRLSQSVFPFKF